MRASLLVVVVVSGCVRQAPAPSPTPPPAQGSLEALLAVRQPSGASPAFPSACRRDGRIAFVAVPPLATLDVAALAERYRRVYGVEIEVLPALRDDAIAQALDAGRGQYESGRVLSVLGQAFAAAPGPPRWLIGLTDGDLFWAEKNWRFSFSSYRRPAAIVSTARTEPATSRSAGRVMKLVSRVLAETWCGLERGGPKNSVLAPTLLGLDDLDAIDESVWERGPSSL